jgi:hypothetical protein
MQQLLLLASAASAAGIECGGKYKLRRPAKVVEDPISSALGPPNAHSIEEPMAATAVPPHILIGIIPDFPCGPVTV